MSTHPTSKPAASGASTGSPLTDTQRRLVKELTSEWRDIREFDWQFHAIGNTLKALEKRRIIETRPKPGVFYMGYPYQEQARLIEAND